MSDKIYIKRSVKEKLPEVGGTYFVTDPNQFADDKTAARFSIHRNNWFNGSDTIHPSHWLEQVPLEEYLKEIGLEIKIKESNECEECKKSDSLRFDGHRYICTRCEIDL